MSEPIILRSEAIKQVSDTLAGKLDSNANGQSNAELQSLSSNVTSNQTSLGVMRNDIVQMKTAIELIQNQISEIVAQVNAAVSNVDVKLEDIVVEEPDAPTEEDQVTTENPAPITYRIDNGAMDLNNFKADSTTTCKHYTYDTFHLVCVSTSFVGGAQTDTEYTLATFPTLSTYSGNGFLNPFTWGTAVCGTTCEGNTIKMKVYDSVPPKAQQTYYSTWWFDRSQASRMFDIQEGQLISSSVAVASPYYAMHAVLGNLHFLSVSTKSIAQITPGSQTSICQFTSALSITTGAYMGMGYAYSSDKKQCIPFYVVAPNNNTIAIDPNTIVSTYVNSSFTIPANMFITINLVWIDSKATAADSTIAIGSVPACDSADRFAKHFTYKHLNCIQMYGNHSSVYPSTCIGRFENKIVLPFYDTIFALPRISNSMPNAPNTFGMKVWTQGLIQQSSETEFNDNSIAAAMQRKNDKGEDVYKYSNGYINAQILWMA